MNQATHSTTQAIYIMDPMCSWCWAFAPAWQALRSSLDESVVVRYVMGALAPDTDEPMPGPMRRAIADTWRVIEQRTGAAFNHEYWQTNVPRRSTYPACRAAIAAGLLDADGLPRMVSAIQDAYYLKARNPSLESVLIDIAESIGLDRDVFSAELGGSRVGDAFDSDLELTRRLGVQGFPAVVASRRDAQGDIRHALVSHGYCDATTLIGRWRQLSASPDDAA